MMKRLLAALPLLALLAVPASAQTFQEEMVRDLEAVAQKFIGLAEAMPESEYGWRPGEGVRSIGEVYMHIALANAGLPGSFFGSDMPEDWESAWQEQGEQYADKAGVARAIRVAFDHLKSIVGGMSDAEMEMETNVFGRDTNFRAGLVLLLTHSHEHLGQSIAYARTRGVTPPWSM